MFFALTVNYLLCTSLFLLLLFDGSLTCGNNKGKFFNRPRRQISKQFAEQFEKQANNAKGRTATNKISAEELNTKNEANIKAALDRLREVLSSDNEGKKSIDRKVIGYFSNKPDFQPHSSVSNQHASPPERCTEVKTSDIPRPSAIFTKLTPTHFMINIPNFNQTVEDAYKCTNVGESCTIDDIRRSKSSPGKCSQRPRLLDVLVLPNTKQNFDVSDFKVAKYEVYGGCGCAKSAPKLDFKTRF